MDLEEDAPAGLRRSRAGAGDITPGGDHRNVPALPSAAQAPTFLETHVRLHCKVTGAKRRLIEALVRRADPHGPRTGVVECGSPNTRELASEIGCTPRHVNWLIERLHCKVANDLGVIVYVSRTFERRPRRMLSISTAYPKDFAEDDRRRAVTERAMAEAAAAAVASRTPVPWHERPCRCGSGALRPCLTCARWAGLFSGLVLRRAPGRAAR